VTFIGRTVICAFTSAAAVTIATSQIKGLLGLSFEAEGFIQTWKAIFQHISETRYQDAVLGIVCCIALLLLKVSLPHSSTLSAVPWHNVLLRKSLF
jgi:sodium-independent sulfate anion transporter 11